MPNETQTRLVPLADDGTFTCPCGEVTTWIPGGSVTGHCPACGRGFVFAGHCLVTNAPIDLGPECQTTTENPK